MYCQKQVVNVAMPSCVKTHENDRVFLPKLVMLRAGVIIVWHDACFQHLPTDSKAS